MSPFLNPTQSECVMSLVSVLLPAQAAGSAELDGLAGWVVDVVRWLGVAFLLTYAAASLRRVLSPESLHAGGGG